MASNPSFEENSVWEEMLLSEDFRSEVDEELVGLSAPVEAPELGEGDHA